jgi:two-component system sensor histidine kinase and response regulator WspE
MASSSDKALGVALRASQEEFFNEINAAYSEISDFLLRMENFSSKLYNEVFLCRIRPFGDGVGGFPRMVRDVARKLGKKARLEINGLHTDVDRDILEKLEAPINHILRNAIDHGLETPEERVKAGKPDCGLITLSAYHWAGSLNIKIADDGRGVDVGRLRQKIVERGLASEEMVKGMSDQEALEFLFLPGFSTASEVTEISGRGVGLDVVKSMVDEVRGLVRIETRPGKGACFHLQLPVTLSVISALIALIGDEPYAFPLVRVERLLMVPRDDIQSLGSHQFIVHDGSNIGLVSARELLGLPLREIDEEALPVVVVGDRGGQYAVVVDSFVGEREIVVRPLDERLGKVAFISSASVGDDGSALLILDVDDMVKAIDGLLKGGSLRSLRKSGTARKDRKRVLVADDSITVRELERNLLSNQGYEIDVAVDGAEAWNAIRLGEYDLVVTDVDMPRMNGFELVERIKANERLKAIPVVIVSYKDREEDRLRGLEAGADYYLTKGSFHDNSFIQAISDLIGGPFK